MPGTRQAGAGAGGLERIRADEVHVWIAALDGADVPAGRLEPDLSPGELERAASLRFETDRRRFVAAHAFVRRVLARYLGCAPRAVPIALGPTGKPRLEALLSLRFNLAHSHELAACALARDREVGIDVERVRSVPDREALARRVLSEREQAALRAWEGEQADRAFLTAWTRKEAVLKAWGEGLGREPAGVEVSLDPDGPARLLGVDGVPGAERRWTVDGVDAGPDYVAAVSAEGRGWVVRRRLVDARFWQG